MNMFSDLFKVIMPLLAGTLFITSYFLADMNEFFRFFAYFPRKRKGSVRFGSLIFGAAFIIVGIYNYLATY